MNFFINITFETNDYIYYYDSLLIYTKIRKVLKIFINARLTGVLFVDLEISVHTNDKNGEEIQINYGKDNDKKQYNGTHIITIDVSRIECYDFVKAIIERGMNYISLNNISLKFEESFLSIDYKSFKNTFSNYNSLQWANYLIKKYHKWAMAKVFFFQFCFSPSNDK